MDSMILPLKPFLNLYMIRDWFTYDTFTYIYVVKYFAKARE